MDRREKALIIFYNKDQQILLQNREGISKHGERWGYFGGGIESGETPTRALVREIKEELCYDLYPPSFLGVFRGTTRNKLHVYCSPLDDISLLHQLEGDSMQFFSVEGALELEGFSEADKKILIAMRQYFIGKEHTVQR